MRAVVCTRYGPPKVLELRGLPKPEPRSSEVCLRIAAIAVTARACIVGAFNMPLRLELPMGAVLGFRAPRNPILGLPEKAILALKPSNVTYDEAAATPYGGLLARYFLRQAGIESRKRVLVYGASGAIGTTP